MPCNLHQDWLDAAEISGLINEANLTFEVLETSEVKLLFPLALLPICHPTKECHWRTVLLSYGDGIIGN